LTQLTNVTDRQTDTHTHTHTRAHTHTHTWTDTAWQHRPPLCIASRGKIRYTIHNCKGRQIESCIWSIERRRLQLLWTTPSLVFKVTPFFWRWVSQKQYEIHSFNGVHCTNKDLYTPSSTLSFRMTFSDLAKYSMTRSVARLSELLVFENVLTLFAINISPWLSKLQLAKVGAFFDTQCSILARAMLCKKADRIWQASNWLGSWRY